VVSPYSIYPAIHGGAVRIFNLVRGLAEHAEVSMLIFGGGTDDPPQRAALVDAHQIDVVLLEYTEMGQLA